MKTNRNVVRLTESQLKVMIAESVNNVLNEIDWRTADSAYNKVGKAIDDILDKGEMGYYKRAEWY